MSGEFHTIIVDKSLADESMVNKLRVIGKKEGNWTLYKLSVNDSDIEKTIEEIQSNLKDDSWYFHFYNADGSKLIVVYKDKCFTTDCNKKDWNEAIEYGKKLNIPLEQLDFVPNKFSDEQF